jgi:hypothetical protein
MTLLDGKLIVDIQWNMRFEVRKNNLDVNNATRGPQKDPS